MKKYLLLIITTIPFTWAFQSSAQEIDTTFYEMTLEQLMNYEVTSVSKNAEKLQNVPSSIYVITSADIEKSSASSLSELLREYVPGYWSASLNYRHSDSYIRNTNTGSVLVLLDGTPMQELFASTFSYSNFDIPFSEIDRIEVIKGSGGTVYGANSATGVISIFTKKTTENSFETSFKMATPAYSNLNVSGAKKVSDKFSIRTYGQYNYFAGYPKLEEFETKNPIVTNSVTGTDTLIQNRFANADSKIQFFSLGLNSEWEITEKLTLSSNLHFNMALAQAYNIYYPIEKSVMKFDPAIGLYPFAQDTVFLDEDNRNRLVGNLKFNYKFSDKHNLFLRTSTNRERKKQVIAGGYETSHYIVDIEAQDNIVLPYNTLSVGGNYRFVNYNISNLYDSKSINYIDPQNTESLKGVFIHDKISLLNNKLNVYLGAKAENFSLINNKFYLSPMAKIAINPVEKLTLWGGYTHSYTTPGYNETNVELRFFRTSSSNFFSTVVPLQVYQTVYQQAISGGADAVTANAMALNYISSPAGQSDIASGISDGMAAYPNEYSLAAINGNETKPTSFRSFEVGIRFQPFKKVYFESNFFHTLFKDGVLNSQKVKEHVPSPTVAGEYINVYYYGNYIKGSNTGVETIIDLFPVKELKIELSHSLFMYDSEYQENNDFNLDELTSEQKNLVKKDYPPVPKNIFRAVVTYNLPWKMKVNLSGLLATEFYNRYVSVNAYYEHDLQRFDPLYSDNAPYKELVGKQDSRVIVNFRIDKYFMNDKLDMYLWGNDISSSYFVESVNQFTTTYPKQVGRMVGLGINYNF